jgi:hypothetical protein
MDRLYANKAIDAMAITKTKQKRVSVRSAVANDDNMLED